MHVLVLHKDIFEFVVCNIPQKCGKIVTNITCDSFVTPHIESQVDTNCGIQYNMDCALLFTAHFDKCGILPIL